MNLFKLSAASTLVLAAPLAFGQKPAFKFQPGQWAISSTVTTSNGRQVSRKTTVCAHTASDTGSHHAPNEQCDPPTVTNVPQGIRVQLACQGGSGPVTWKMQSDVTELFSADGSSFTETGKTTTTTTVPGHAPMVMSATIASQGQHTGACSK